jgi:purine-binding chemotaxis protein CheW
MNNYAKNGQIYHESKSNPTRGDNPMEEILAATEDTQHGRYLTFALGSESFGLEISYVKEIVGMQPITTIPESPGYVKGIINLRGKIISIIDMRLKFGMEEAAYNDRTCIVVIDVNDTPAGLIVDNVSEVISIEDENIAPLPGYGSGTQNRYIKGIGKVGGDVKLLLQAEELFNEGELNPAA